MARFARLRGGGLYLPVGEAVANPPSDECALVVDADGSVKQLLADGSKVAVGGGTDMRSIVSRTAGSVLSAGFADFWVDFDGSTIYALSGANANSYLPVNTEGGGKRRLTTQATPGGVAEVLPSPLVALVINPKVSAWYAEGRAAIETHAANSALFPVSVALTSGGAMTGAPASNTFCGLGLVGTGFTGGNNSSLSFAAASGGTMVLQTTTIPWTAAIHSYGLSFDGSGTITAWLDGAPVWTTTTLTQIGSGGFHANQWVACSDASPTTMLVDYIYAAGTR